MFNFLKNLIGGSKEAPEPNITPEPIIEPVIEPVIEKKPIEVKKKEPKILTAEKLKTIINNNPEYMEWFILLDKFLPKYEINTPKRIAAFLANVTHESADFKYLEENLNYSKQRLLAVFPKYFNASNVDKYARKKIAIASRIYANRMGNGPESSKDGWTYRGKGLIQITGKNNTTSVSRHVNKSIEETCQYLLTKEGALIGSLYFWKKNNINLIADTGDITRVRKAVNGGTIGLTDTTARYNNILKILG
jgi:putative chitinase